MVHADRVGVVVVLVLVLTLDHTAQLGAPADRGEEVEEPLETIEK